MNAGKIQEWIQAHPEALVQALIFVATVLLVRSALEILVPKLRERIEIAKTSHGERLEKLFRPVRLARRLALLQYLGPVVGAIVGLVVSRNLFIPFVLAAVAYFVPAWYLRHLEEDRRRRIAEQLPDALQQMVSGARAGMNLTQLVHLVAEKTGPPLREEFELIVAALKLRRSLQESLERSRERVGLPQFDLMVTALLVYQEKGGNLAQLLERIAGSLRELMRLEKKVKTETASIQFSAKLMAAMPVFFAVILWLVDPESMGTLFSSLVGSLLLAVVAALTLVGYTMIRRLANPDL